MQKDFTLFISLVIFFSLVFDSVGQQASSGFDLRYKVGYLSIHHESMAHLPKSPAQAVELTYFQHTQGKRSYQLAYRFPTLGATFFTELLAILNYLADIQVFMASLSYL